jgi:hypothetical protein
MHEWMEFYLLLSEVEINLNLQGGRETLPLLVVSRLFLQFSYFSFSQRRLNDTFSAK